MLLKTFRITEISVVRTQQLQNILLFVRDSIFFLKYFLNNSKINECYNYRHIVFSEITDLLTWQD